MANTTETAILQTVKSIESLLKSINNVTKQNNAMLKALHTQNAQIAALLKNKL